MTKYYLQITSVVLLFIGCAVGGYFLADVAGLGTSTGKGGSTGGGSANGVSTDRVAIVGGPKEAVQDVVKVPTTKNVETPVKVPSTTKDDVVETPVKEPSTTKDNVVETPVKVSSTTTDDVKETSAKATTPVIKHVWYPPFKDWHSGKPGRIGYKVVVTALVESQDKLKYEMMSNDGKWKYSSTSGTFPEVYPTEDGLYTLVVTNTRTQEPVKQDVKGLVKRPKLGAASIEKQLREGALDKKFYFYFTPNVKFRCLGSGVPAGSTPKTLNALVGVAGMYDIDVKDESLQYDEWNRITSFDIELN